MSKLKESEIQTIYSHNSIKDLQTQIEPKIISINERLTNLESLRLVEPLTITKNLDFVERIEEELELKSPLKSSPLIGCGKQTQRSPDASSLMNSPPECPICLKAGDLRLPGG